MTEIDVKTEQVQVDATITQGNENKTISEQMKSIQSKSVEEQSIEQSVESAQDINWKKYREQREIERKQKAEAEKRAAEKAAEAEALKAAMEALLNKSQGISQQQYHQEEDLSDDERIERKIQAALEKRYQQEEQIRIQKEQQEYPQKLVQTFQDFNHVCTTENLDYLEYHYPEITAAYKYMPDGYDKWSSVYKAVKKLVPNTDTKKDLQKMERNLQKPQSISTQGIPTTSSTALNRIDDAKKAANWERMQKAMKGLS